MFKYTMQRILYMMMVFFIITMMCFILVRMLPQLPLDPMRPETTVVEARREAMGYNKPYLVQFGIFLKNIFTDFNWGVSEKLYYGQEVVKVFVTKMPPTKLGTEMVTIVKVEMP